MFDEVNILELIVNALQKNQDLLDHPEDVKECINEILCKEVRNAACTLGAHHHTQVS